ncbi:MAG TPA: glycoside hydrolase family 2 TIM barrel-domain containing protein [Acidobacteriota bacterium]|nr:glycoside hydrolase family 2 TIM barrel-domain containing protein [Acidobacteriota bacterium]
MRLTQDLGAAWRFHYGELTAPPTLANAASWAAINLPHTWNATDGADGGGNYARGTGWYVRPMTLSREWGAKRVFIEFDGASRAAKVFLNGQLLGEHVGGFARFRFDLTPALRRDAENVLAVAVSNAPDGTAPYSADFTFFGGLYRGVRLVGVDDVHVELMDHASPGVYVTPQRVSAEHADVSVAVLLRNDAVQDTTAELEVTLRDAAGTVVGVQRKACELAAGMTTRSSVEFALANPRLWQGRRDPHQYRATVVVRAGGVVRDVIEERFGVRVFRIDAERGFFLNGESLDLHGVSRHQDRAGKGWAISEADEREDFALIREMGCTAVRVAHYQQSPLWFDLADENGLIVWAEIPVINEVPAGALYLENARQQLRELIRQNYNRPAIICWGVGNETREDGEKSGGPIRPNGAESNRVLAALAQTAKSEDPTRPSVYASHHQGEDTRNFHTEVTAFNRYYGWYHGRSEEIGAWLDDVHRRYPALRFGISEYGAGANPAQHELPARKPPHAGPWHPEEYQNDYHEKHWLAFRSRPFLWCKFIWNMFDFAVDSRNEGSTPGMNDKGLVSYDRSLKKDAFFWYKANWSAEPVLYLTSRRYRERAAGPSELKAYSNAPRAELWLDGKSLGVIEGRDRIFRWPIDLSVGEHHAVVRAGGLSDEIVFTCLPPKAAATP